MTANARIRSIRLMEKMERLNQSNSNLVEKAEDGTLNYKDKNGNVLIEAKMKESE